MSSQSEQFSPIRLFKTAIHLRDFVRGNPRHAFGKFLIFCMAQSSNSPAQLLQDLFVLFILQVKRNGYFVEIGASNGLDLSNTFLLESQYGWSGTLAEPARCWHEALQKNRKSNIDLRCVWSESGKTLSFTETDAPEFSTITKFSDNDVHGLSRQSGRTYEVETVSLNDLLLLHRAPRSIDYMSIDTEGSEFEILRSFDFDRYDVSIMTLEHNWVAPLRGSLHDLLTSKGYVRVFDEISQWDDWYVKQTVLSAFSL